MKLFPDLPQYMPRPLAKFHQNWWSGFRKKRAQDTEGHSFIIIRIYKSARKRQSKKTFPRDKC